MAVQGAGVSGQADQNLQELLDQPFTEATEQAVADRMARATEERAAPAETIDLTGDGDSEEAPHAGTSRAADSTSSRAQRLPRFERNIIDIDSSDNEEEPPQTRNMPGNFTADDDDGESLFMPQLPQRNYPQDLAPIGPRRTISGLRRHGFVRQPSPAMPLDDVEVVGSRPISQVQSRRQTPNIMSGNRSITPFPGENNNATIDLTQDDDDDVVFTEMRTLPGVNADRPAIGGRGNGVRDSPELYGGHGLGRLAALMARTNRDLPDFVAFRDRFLAERQARAEDQLDAARRRTLDAQQRLNNLRDNLATQNEERMMNRRPARPPTLHRLTALPGADMEFGLAAFDLGLGMQRPPTPKYEPPAPAVEGFTRNPEEEEVVVCPNCGDELAMGDTEIKQQVWVVKPCGHVSYLSWPSTLYLSTNSYCRHTVAIVLRTAPVLVARAARVKGRARCPTTFRCRHPLSSAWSMAVRSRSTRTPSSMSI